ncbi:MAG: prepilin-type N-terminal cleavage/methylation domain-containing protein [Candidatus Levybacteria bacterium]|nr:prepilin-type N-terminal cleavage/methylation domain-containing protein [Candidatus Levybacteria bacterium]
MKTIFISVILNCATSVEESPLGGFQDLFPEKTRCRNKFGMTKRATGGFTLIELLVVIGIIGILTAFLMANFVGIRQRARDGARKSDLRQIQAALELYRSDKSAYPTALPACEASLTDGADPPVTYMQKIPCDPLSTPAYAYNSNGSTYSLIACLENKNDSQKDTVLPDPNPCNQSTNFAYTLQNP